MFTGPGQQVIVKNNSISTSSCQIQQVPKLQISLYYIWLCKNDLRLFSHQSKSAQFELSIWIYQFWMINLNYQFGLSMWIINLNYQFELSIWIINLNYQFELSIWIINLNYQFELSIWIINLNYQFELSIWIINLNYQFKLSFKWLYFGLCVHKITSRCVIWIVQVKLRITM